ncbi:MAG: hypothetical protein EX260_08035 [Desulfobulbaceae bacterium]|nr:MAG: hypothetical protein EX260_08035 [Desulfobulbaceae bacterium]
MIVSGRKDRPSLKHYSRQLLHVAHKVAAESGSIYLEAVREHRLIVGRHVTGNFFQRHIRPLFL